MPINVYTILDDPKATSGTQAFGINALGQVVGSYSDGTGGGTHGFLYNGGTYTTLDDPDAGSTGVTIAQGINDAGRIVGYTIDQFGSEFGFIKTGANYTQVFSPAPNGTHILLHGISDFNQVVGEYTDKGGITRAVVELADLFLYVTVDFPGFSTGTILSGINAAGTELVAQFQDNTGSHLALYDGPSHLYTLFDDPIAANGGIIANGINDAGQVVGYYFDVSSQAHGFIFDTRSFNFTTVDVGAHGTYLTGINDAGQIVGYYADSSNQIHGFIRTTVPNPAPSGGTTAAMVLRGANSSAAIAGQYEIYDIGNNAILAGYLLGQVGTDYRFAGLGRFFDGDTVDMMLRSASTGAFEIYDISNNNITNAAALGAVGLNWQVGGFADFNSDGMTDLMLRNSGTGAFQVYNISNNSIINSASVGTVGLDWQVGGFGNFSSLGESDMILRNTKTGGLEVYDISNNQITNAAFLGTIGLDWQFSGVGNFSGIPGETDLLLRNVNAGGLEVYNIANNQLTGAAFLGTVGLNWQFAGIAPVHAAGASDLVLRNVNTGQFEVYNIANNQLVGAALLGQVGLDWQLGGFAVDPPTDDASAGQLVQAMAGFGAGSGAADGFTTSLGPDTSQQTFLTTPQHA
jgi:probable HAF family extracellular repeat protein